MTTMTDNDLDALATKIAAKILERFPAANVPETATAYPEKLSRTQAARFVGGKPFKPSAQASGTDQTLLRELRVKPILSRHHFHGRETRSRDYFSKTALMEAMVKRG